MEFPGQFYVRSTSMIFLKWLPTIMHYKDLKNSIIDIIHFIEIGKIVFNSITTKLLNMCIVFKYKYIACSAHINDCVSFNKVNGSMCFPLKIGSD